MIRVKDQAREGANTWWLKPVDEQSYNDQWTTVENDAGIFATELEAREALGMWLSELPPTKVNSAMQYVSFLHDTPPIALEV